MTRTYSLDGAPLKAFSSFADAASAVLKLLHQTFGMELWMVTRTENENWIVLSAEDHGYGIKSGDVFVWNDSFCSRMVRGEGPRIAPDSSQVPAYVQAPIGWQVEIGAYIGVPLTRPDGTLFGTLCAIDRAPQPEDLTEHQATLEMYASLLATILHVEMENERVVRLLETTAAESDTDALTGLYNRRGWDRLVNREEARCRRYGDPAGILVYDLDELKQVNDRDGHQAGDELLRRTAALLTASVGASDIVARLGGDEFAVLVNASGDAVGRVAERTAEALRTAGIRISVGWAARDPREGLVAALQAADHAMYRQKRVRRGTAPLSAPAPPAAD